MTDKMQIPGIIVMEDPRLEVKNPVDVMATLAPPPPEPTRAELRRAATRSKVTPPNDLPTQVESFYQTCAGLIIRCFDEAEFGSAFALSIPLMPNDVIEGVIEKFRYRGWAVTHGFDDSDANRYDHLIFTLPPTFLNDLIKLLR